MLAMAAGHLVLCRDVGQCNADSGSNAMFPEGFMVPAWPKSSYIHINYIYVHC